MDKLHQVEKYSQNITHSQNQKPTIKRKINSSIKRSKEYNMFTWFPNIKSTKTCSLGSAAAKARGKTTIKIIVRWEQLF